MKAGSLPESHKKETEVVAPERVESCMDTMPHEPHEYEKKGSDLPYYCHGVRPERDGRELDSQALPIKNNEPFVQDAVIADIEARKQVGIKRYGTALQAGNGRDALLDAYEEAMDLTIYLKQALMEREKANAN